MTLLANRYQLTSPLDQTHTVWLGWDSTLHREVAVRRIERDELQTLRTVSRIRHPALLVVHDVIIEDGQAWIVTELTDGTTLADLTRPDEAWSASLGTELLSALTAVHALGVVHGAIEPRSIVRTRDGRLKLTGFGTNRPHELFQPPEDIPLPASDVWGLAATLSAVAEGRPPFVSRDAIRTGEPLPPVAAPRLGEALGPAFAPDPAARPSADAVRRQLRQLAPTPTRTRGPLRLPPAVLVALAAVWVAVVATAAVMLSWPGRWDDRIDQIDQVDQVRPVKAPVPGRTQPFADVPSPCLLLTDQQIKSLIPAPDPGRPWQTERCSWNSIIEASLQLPDRLTPSVNLSLELSDSPKKDLQLAHEIGAISGKVRGLTGLGDEAYLVSHSITSQPTHKSYEVEVHFRMANIVVTLRYSRRSGGPDPMMDAAAEQAACWVATAMANV